MIHQNPMWLCKNLKLWWDAHTTPYHIKSVSHLFTFTEKCGIILTNYLRSNYG